MLPGSYPAGAALTLLGRVGADVRGCVSYRRLEFAVCEVKRLYVRPGFRRTGLGRNLVACLIAHARAADHKVMRLETVLFMDRASRLYEEMGCCQSNRNSSPIGGAVALGARPQAMRDCHSASAAERRSL